MARASRDDLPDEECGKVLMSALGLARSGLMHRSKRRSGGLQCLTRSPRRRQPDLRAVSHDIEDGIGLDAGLLQVQ
jgi:hypothetical protein